MANQFDTCMQNCHEGSRALSLQGREGQLRPHDMTLSRKSLTAAPDLRKRHGCLANSGSLHGYAVAFRGLRQGKGIDLSILFRKHFRGAYLSFFEYIFILKKILTRGADSIQLSTQYVDLVN